MSKPLLQDLVVTIFGLYAHDAALTASALVRLLADLGVTPGASRSTLSRLTAKGVLLREAEASPSSYSLSPAVLDGFRDGDQRIFQPRRATPDTPWAVVVFSVPEAERARRYELRTELTSLGFGFMASGVAIAPGHVLDQALARLHARDLARFVQTILGHYVDAVNVPKSVAAWWDLDALDAEYTHFIAQYGPLLDTVTEETAASGWGRLAYSTYVPLLTAWRRFPYRDPNIPLALLPAGWQAPDAKRVFLTLHSRLAAPAREHAATLIEPRSATRRPQPNAPR